MKVESIEASTYYAFLVGPPIVTCTVPDALLPLLNCPELTIGASCICSGRIISVLLITSQLYEDSLRFQTYKALFIVPTSTEEQIICR